MEFLIGAFGFFLCFLYDWNRVFWKKRLISKFFLFGTLCQIFAGGSYLYLAWNGEKTERYIWIIMSLVFLVLLVYTLFFALPFENTYCHDAENNKVCKSGIYGVCRHPGIWWYFGCFGCLGMATGKADSLASCMMLSCLNLLYAWYQDKWIFPKEFCDYLEYQKEVPFLLPLKRK